VSSTILDEQFGFLDGKQIHEAIGIIQEGLHSIKIKKKSSFIIKLDLSKAFDNVNWSYLILMMLHVGFTYEFVNGVE
jgi:hypothetical protein